MSENYDVQQVCENGHQITGCYQISKSERQDFCQKCGAATMTACPSCGGEIQGAQIVDSRDLYETITKVEPRMVPMHHVNVPSWCSNCGKPYPWTADKIATAIQILEEFGNLNDEEKRTIEQDINNIAKDTPKTELSAMRIKRILAKCGTVAYNVIMEFASKTAAEILKNP